jgi:hypothetical protein
MGADTGLPCSARITGRVRSCLSAGRVSVRAALSRQAGSPFSAPFWPQPKLSPDGSLKPNDVYQQFTYVDRTFQALLPDGLRLGRRHAHLTVRLSLTAGFVVPTASHLPVASHARVGRLPLAKQRVLSQQDGYSCDLTSHRGLIRNDRARDSCFGAEIRGRKFRNQLFATVYAASDGTRLGQPGQGLPCWQGILEDAVTPAEVFRKRLPFSGTAKHPNEAATARYSGQLSGESPETTKCGVRTSLLPVCVSLKQIPALEAIKSSFFLSRPR